MNDAAILREAARRFARGEPCVLATVVRRVAPSSARVGMKALVGPEGELTGWLGGSCIEPVVRREARTLLGAGGPRRLLFTPDPASVEEEPDLDVRPMTCHSGGSVEIYLEPHRPAPLLALFGDSPVTRALAEIAPTAGFRVLGVEVEGVDRLEPESAGSAELYCLVATLGEWDEEALRQATEADPVYLGLVASPRRARAIRAFLGEEGVPKARLARIVGPAGLDLGAETPGEIAVSILAELVEVRRSGEGRSGAADGGDRSGASGEERDGAEEDASVDPVCGMTVPPSNDRHVERYGEVEYRFCSGGCRERFRADPGRYVETSG